jgi:hypothetical protein
LRGRASQGSVETQFVEDPTTSRQAFTYSFVVRWEGARARLRGRGARSRAVPRRQVRLLKPINPRLCRFLVTRNDRTDLFFPPNSIDRVPLSPDFQLPKTRCMLANGTEEGAPIETFPKFSPGGVIGPVNSLALKFPLCGDLYFFRRGTALKFSGEIDAGLVRILECQSGAPLDQNDYVMVPLWQADCTQVPRQPGYEQGTGLGDRAQLQDISPRDVGT